MRKRITWADIPAWAGVTAPLAAEETVDGAERKALLRSRMWGKRTAMLLDGKSESSCFIGLPLELMCPKGYINSN